MKVNRHNSGFSLVEVMCAILILGIALAGMTQGITTALTSSKESELQTTAALFAAGLIETLRSEEYLSDGVTEGDCGEGLSLYHWKESITSAGIDGLHQVEIVMENAKTGQSIYELQTLLFQLPDNSSRGGSPRPNESGLRRRGGR